MPFPEGIGPKKISKQMTDAFARNGLRSVYAFSCTKPTEDDRTMLGVLDAWCEAGHHVGNHTHGHCSLNGTSIDRYIEDIDRSHEVIRRYVDKAPTRYFRYPFDMWGDQKDKTDAVMRTARHARPGPSLTRRSPPQILQRVDPVRSPRSRRPLTSGG